VDNNIIEGLLFNQKIVVDGLVTNSISESVITTSLRGLRDPKSKVPMMVIPMASLLKLYACRDESIDPNTAAAFLVNGVVDLVDKVLGIAIEIIGIQSFGLVLETVAHHMVVWKIRSLRRLKKSKTVADILGISLNVDDGIRDELSIILNSVISPMWEHSTKKLKASSRRKQVLGDINSFCKELYHLSNNKLWIIQSAPGDSFDLALLLPSDDQAIGSADSDSMANPKRKLILIDCKSSKETCFGNMVTRRKSAFKQAKGMLKVMEDSAFDTAFVYMSTHMEYKDYKTTETKHPRTYVMTRDETKKCLSISWPLYAVSRNNIDQDTN
jgi:hypothetical protein